MRNHFSTITIMILFSAFCWSCSNELEEIQNSEPSINEMNVSSRSSSSIDYSQYMLLEKRTIMPKIGEFYNGTINYRGLSFGVNLYWDFEIEDYNMYGYIYGSCIDLAGDTHYMYHVATYKSASNNYQLCYIIKCNYIIDDSGFEHKNHVSFYVTYTPSSQTLTYNVIEEGEGLWESEL